jgi:hypothetical protein
MCSTPPPNFPGGPGKTRKLFEFCRLRDVPIITFVNMPMMMILKSPVSGFMFRHREFFTDGGLGNAGAERDL